MVVAPENEVEDDEGHDDAEDSKQGKTKLLLHSEEWEQAFEDLIETGSVASPC